MDGRNLTSSIILKWTPEIGLASICNTIPIFIKNVLNANDYQFYGEFLLNAVYDMRNFNNMLVTTFPCRIDTNRDEKVPPLFFGDPGEFVIILSDDCFILFKNFTKDKKDKENTLGKIVFWCTLFNITDLQINKERKSIRIHFESDKKLGEQLRLIIENILFFKETLIKKMSNLKTEVEINKLIKGKYIENKITSRDIKNMNTDQIEDGVNYFAKKIENNEVDYYIVDMFNYLSSKVVEYYSKVDAQKQMNYILQMKKVLQNPKVKEILIQNKDKKKKQES